MSKTPISPSRQTQSFPLQKQSSPISNSLSENLILDSPNIQSQNNTQIINEIPFPLITNSLQSSSNVKVMCRFRPIIQNEKKFTKENCIISLSEDQVEIKSKNEYNNFTFHFDHIFNVDSTQKEIYEYCAKDLVDSVLSGYNGTIFAYGQTASGKTYTMEGIIDDPEKEGIIPRMIKQVFKSIMLSNGDIEYMVKISIIEIYMEKIRDLLDLSKVNLNVRENKDKEIYIEDLSEHYVSTEEDVMELIRIGSENRTTNRTNMNEISSRSHSLVVMTIHQKNIKTLEAKSGKLYLVDLAGSEKISKTGSTGITLEEAKIINKSLSTLGMVINALTDGKSTHIPYRESKLTRVLQESLGGNSKTCLIITCSPSQYNESETLSTLRFGTRAKKMKNKPKINKEVTVQELKLKVEKLEKLLVICNARITQLTDFIIQNGLEIPIDKENLVAENLNNNNLFNLNKKNNNEKNDNENNNNLISDYLLQNASNDLNEIEKKYSGILEKMNELEGEKSDIVSKLEEANIKIEDLQAIIDQKEKIEEDFQQKEEQYNKTINELSENLKNFQSKDIIKKNLKIIDKKILGEFYNQLKDYTLGSKISKNKDANKKILENLSKIINSNFNTEITKIDQEILNKRLECQRAVKLQVISNGPIIDYKEMNENYIISNITNEALLKSVNEKNDRISRLESDMNEYKEKLDLLENRLTPDEKNLYKKIYTLEQNLREVNKMYHLTLQEKCILKVENQILSKKIQKRNEKINSLTKEKMGLLEQFRDMDHLNDVMNNYLARRNVVKVIRGGKQNYSNNNNDDKNINS